MQHDRAGFEDLDGVVPVGGNLAEGLPFPIVAGGLDRGVYQRRLIGKAGFLEGPADAKIADIAKSLGCLTVGVVTKPFLFEGNKRRKQAEQGLVELKAAVDTLITIPNQRLLTMATERTLMSEAFAMADDVLLQAVKGISDLINYQGIINVDFADVRTIMAQKGLALMGVGIGNVFATTIATIGRNPSIQSRVAALMWIGFALVEAIGLYALLVAFIVLFG